MALLQIPRDQHYDSQYGHELLSASFPTSSVGFPESSGPCSRAACSTAWHCRCLSHLSCTQSWHSLYHSINGLKQYSLVGILLPPEPKEAHLLLEVEEVIICLLLCMDVLALLQMTES